MGCAMFISSEAQRSAAQRQTATDENGKNHARRKPFERQETLAQMRRRTSMEKRNMMKAAVGAAAALAVGSLAGKASAAAMGPVLAVISHPVKDYAVWRAIYDSAEPIRQKAGVTGAEVFHDPKDPNLMVIIHRFASLDAAQAFLGDPGLRAAMEKGGVTAPPTAIMAVAV